MDLLNCLEPDMMENVLTRLDDPSDIVRMGAVSRSYRHFVVERGLCKKLCLRIFPQLSKVASVAEVNNRATEDCSEIASSSSSSPMERATAVREHSVYAFLAKHSSSPETGNCIVEAFSASSTDNYPDESIVNTLVARDIVEERASYWSSTGQRDANVPETLVYKLVSNLCVITEISIQPFKAFFQPGFPIYAAKAVRFRMGYLKSPRELANSLKPKCIHDGYFVWTYTSEAFDMDQRNRLQTFKLRQPVLFIGGYLQIELLGRTQQQETDGLYYICVSHVKVKGHSLVPALDAASIEPSGKFVLKRDWKADLEHPGGPLQIFINHLDTRVRTFDQIVEIMRGNEFGLELSEEDDSDEEEYMW